MILVSMIFIIVKSDQVTILNFLEEAVTLIWPEHFTADKDKLIVVLVKYGLC